MATNDSPDAILSLPAKPKRMSEKCYRELHDSRPVIVTITGEHLPATVRMRTAGRVSAAVIANTYLRDGCTVTAEYA